MGSSGRYGKGGRNGDAIALRPTQLLVQCWKTNVVANRQAQSPNRSSGDRDHLLPWLVSVRFSPAFPTVEIDVEHMYLVVAARDVSVWINHESAICPSVIWRLYGKRSERNPNARPMCSIPCPNQRRRVAFQDYRLRSPLSIAIEQARHFRREYHGSAIVRRRNNGVFNGCGVLFGIDTRSHLQDGNAGHSTRQHSVEFSIPL